MVSIETFGKLWQEMREVLPQEVHMQVKNELWEGLPSPKDDRFFQDLAKELENADLELRVDIFKFAASREQELTRKYIDHFYIGEADQATLDQIEIILLQVPNQEKYSRVFPYFRRTFPSMTPTDRKEMMLLLISAHGLWVAHPLVTTFRQFSEGMTPAILEEIAKSIIEFNRYAAASVAENFELFSTGMDVNAKAMQCSLVANEVSDEENRTYEGEIRYLGGSAPYIYSDAFGGNISGPKTIKGKFNLIYSN